MLPTPEQQRDHLFAEVRRVVASLPAKQPAFELTIGWAQNYDELLRQKVDRGPEASILEAATKTSRVILSGRGGGGKTQLLYRLARAALDQSILPVFVNLKNWTRADYGRWAESHGALGGGGSYLLDRFAEPQLTPQELDWLPPGTRKLVILDGLNEISATTGQQVLEALSDLVQSQIQLRVVVADRLLRRELPAQTRWALGLVLPLDKPQIERRLGAQVVPDALRPALDLPFFLDAVLSGAPVDRDIFLAAHVGLNEEETRRAAAVAFALYESSGTRTFALEEFVGLAGQEVSGKLLQAGILVDHDGNAQFSHHLYHDYLAARHVAHMKEEDWTSKTLDTISLKRSSFDAIARVFEQLDKQRCETFLRHVYNWNLYAAGYALAEGITAADHLSQEMQVVILAMLGEKRFDRVQATRRRADDALVLQRISIASPFVKAKSLDDIFEATLAVESNEGWFVEWRKVFTRARGQQVDDEDMRALLQRDSIMGWTLANVMKRSELAGPQLAALRSQLKDADPTIRWRIAHVLGSFPSQDNVAALLSLVDNDTVEDVRYGAARSLAEIASRGNHDLQRTIVDAIKGRVTALLKDSNVLNEFARGLLVVPEDAPAGWTSVVLEIAIEIFRNVDELDERDHWRSYASMAEKQYAA